MNNPSNDLRVVKTKQNIKNTLLNLLSEKNISKITVTELSQKAMINRKTFYRHYQTIEDVAHDIENDLVESLLSSLKKSHNTTEAEML